ncbi:MAG: transposase [Actinobacteria bacterium]|nr:transposase [Actinomycetota bacterium]
MVVPPAQVEFPFEGRRRVRAVFDGGPISSDGGALLLGAVDRRLRLIDTLAAKLPDWRDPRYVTHSVSDSMRQRVIGIALGYEDCNDADTLRHDPVLKTVCGRDPFGDGDLGSQPTLSRLENSVGGKTSYKLALGFVDSYCARKPRRPRQVIIDLDLTDDPTHGQQELAFFRSPRFFSLETRRARSGSPPSSDGSSLGCARNGRAWRSSCGATAA